MDAKTKETLAAIINASRSQWEKDNLANPFEEIEIACAHLLAASIPASDLGKSIESIKARYYALNGLTALTDAECLAALRIGKGIAFEALAQVFARCKLAKETTSVAEGVRLARLSPSSYAAVNKILATGLLFTKDDKSEASVDTTLAPSARKWAKDNNIDLVAKIKQ
jgi:protein-disulfide isomerase-like protein with CxxC motif